MDDNAVKALNMAFGVLVLVIALAISINMFSKVAATSETLVQFADSTRYYDNVELAGTNGITFTDDEITNGTARLVSADTIIPTLYRYYKENFCVKIYDETNQLIQIFDINLEGKVHSALGSNPSGTTHQHHANQLLQHSFNDESKPYYLWGAPWLGSTEAVKTRIDFFVNGQAGYINNSYVNYKGNKFHEALDTVSANPDTTKGQKPKLFKERFISYSYSGETLETEDGDTLVTGASAKDKIVIIYTMLNN